MDLQTVSIRNEGIRRYTNALRDNSLLDGKDALNLSIHILVGSIRVRKSWALVKYFGRKKKMTS